METMVERLRNMIGSNTPFMPFEDFLGARVKVVELGRSVIEIEMRDHHTNPFGTLHGGVICAIADTAMGVAFSTMLEEGESPTTLELKINYLKPIWKGKVLAVGRVVKKGRTTGLVECDIIDENEQLLARASSTYMAIAGEQAKGRAMPK